MSSLGQVGLWVFARSEGGVLPLLDYLGEAFGLVVPVQLVVASPVSAWVGAAMTTMTDDLRFRRPVEADYATVIGVVDDWWGGREDARDPAATVVPALRRDVLDRRDATTAGSSGFLVGFLSPDRPGRRLHPHDRHGPEPAASAGSAASLYERFFEDARAPGRSG